MRIRAGACPDLAVEADIVLQAQAHAVARAPLSPVVSRPATRAMPKVRRRGRLPVGHQRHGNTQARRGRAATRDHEHPLGARGDTAGLGENSAAGTAVIAEAAITTATGRPPARSSRNRPSAAAGEASLTIR
jgi:hypothetical protein